MVFFFSSPSFFAGFFCKKRVKERKGNVSQNRVIPIDANRRQDTTEKLGQDRKSMYMIEKKEQFDCIDDSFILPS